jgi:steroid delta-isomerase-like uncharacterized protein
LSVEGNKALQRHLFEEMNKGKAATLAAMDETYATDFVYHQADGTDISGLKNKTQLLSEVFNAFPDRHSTIDDMVAEGDKVAVRWTWTATHKGELMGIPSTNKKITIWGISIDCIVDGKFVERWERLDTLGWMQQLGVMPTPEKNK